MKEPLQADLWVHLYIFSNDKEIKSRAIFKAYELEPENKLV
jgi:hypothetical protein